jgi:hypothetical protein
MVGGDALKRFDNNQRVFVRADEYGNAINAHGTVCRLRRADYGAWINLDERHATDVHPFPADDDRGKHILAYPEDCRPERVHRISFWLTRRQYLDRSKTQTRRLGFEALRPGGLFMGVEKCQGLRKGEKQVELGLSRTVSNRRERLDAITPADVTAEGFPGMTPAQFVEMFCKAHGRKRCNPATLVSVIDFEPIDRRI